MKLKKKYMELPKAHKTELRNEFMKQFSYRSDAMFKSIMAGTHTPTPLQSHWLETKVTEYYNHAQGIASPAID